MTALNPAIPVTYPRTARKVLTTGPFWATIQCIFTLGLWPLLVWPTRWSTFVEGERQELLHLANAWRRRVVGREAEQLDSIARRLRPKPMLLVLSWLIVGFNVAIFGLLLMRSNPPRDLWDLTYGHHTVTESRTVLKTDHIYRIEPQYEPFTWRQKPQAMSIDVPVLREPEANLYQIWLGTLLLGYICHWHAVRSHATAVKQLIGWTNMLAKQKHFNEVDVRATRLGLNPGWVFAAIGFCVYSAWWAIPMCLVGAMQRRYITKTSPVVRSALAEQAHLGFERVNIDRDRFCPAHRCGARVSAAAKFCPRCGAGV
jgi:hypothetical protein